MAWSDLNIWVDDVLTRYRRGGEDGTSGSSTFTIKCARNEFESFQILLYNNHASDSLTGVDVTVTEDTSRFVEVSSGNYDSINESIVLYNQWYIQTTTKSRDDYSLGWWPDPLIPKTDRYYGERRSGGSASTCWPSGGFTVPAQQMRAVWVDIGTVSTTPANSYTFNVSVTKSGETTKTATVTLQVWDFELPSSPTIRSYFVLADSALSCGHMGELRQPGYDSWIYGIEALYCKMLLYHRMCVSVTAGGTNYISKDGSWNITSWGNFEDAYGTYIDGDAITTGTYKDAKPPGIDLEWAKFCCNAANYPGSTYYKNFLQDYFDYWLSKGRDPMTELFVNCWDEPMPVQAECDAACDCADDVSEIDTSGRGTWKNVFVISSIDSMLTSPTGGRDSFSDNGFYMSPLYRYCHTNGGSAVPRTSYPDATNWTDRRHYSYWACDLTHGCFVVGGSAYNNCCDSCIETPPRLTRGMHWVMWFERSHGLLNYDVGDFYVVADPYQSTWNGSFYGNGEGLMIYPGVPSKSGRYFNGGYGSNTPEIGGTHDIPIESVTIKSLRDGFEDREYMELARNLGFLTQTDTYVNSIFTTTTGQDAPYAKITTTLATIRTARENIANLILSSSGTGLQVGKKRVTIT